MKEKELRLALVLFGGVSLAVYQHGINRELLNLARASRAYHRVEGPAAKQAPGHAYPAGAGADAWTAEVYFDLLKRLGRTVDLRVLVDVISGASAGAINGIALARALAHDLSLAPVTRLWLERADMQRLIASSAGQPMEIAVDRGGMRLVLRATPALREVKDNFNRGLSDAVRVIRTETHRNMTEGHLAAYDAATEAGVKMEKVWSAVLDERTRVAELILEAESAAEVAGDEYDDFRRRVLSLTAIPAAPTNP